MNPAEKAHRMEDAAERPYSYNISKPDADIAAEAAYFRAITPDANGLLPCPMCGADGRAIICGLPGDYRAVCGECLLGTSPYMTMPDAVAAWNRRGGVVHD